MIHTSTQFVEAVENTLGWVSGIKGVPPWRARAIQAGKVTKKRATDPELYSWHNLELALELCRRERRPQSPLGVFAHVERALLMETESESDLEYRIREAVAYETAHDDPEGWVTTFARATGEYRAEAYERWRNTWIR